MLTLLIFLLLIFALGGGFYVHPLLFAVLAIVLILWLFSGPVDGSPWYDRHWR